MFWFKKDKKAEKRELVQSDGNRASIFGWGSVSSSGVTVNEDNALGVPAIWAAVNFLSGTIASLPLNVYVKSGDSREKSKQPIQSILHDAVNDETTSFDWRKYSFERTFSGGRSITFIQRNGAGKIANLYSLDPSQVTIKRVNNQKLYTWKEGDKNRTEPAKNIIDIPFMLASDNLAAYSPFNKHRDTIGLAIAATDYGAKIFKNGGVPPFVMSGNFQSGSALKRASNDVEEVLNEEKNKDRQVLSLPANHEIKQLGFDPEKMQLVELKRFIIEEVARIYSLPPNFLQDLTNGTFSNVEQQDLHLVKHTIRRWVVQAEQELNLKLFGRGNTNTYVEFNLDGLLRGDFMSRMQGYATGIQNAVIKPNEARAMENRPSDDKGDDLLIQGATVPLGTQPNIQESEGDESGI